MEPHHETILVPRADRPNACLNGHASDERCATAAASLASNEKVFRVNELQLLSMQVEQLTAANHRKDEFLATLSHELRSPLASIQYGLAILRGQEGADRTVERGMHELIDRQVRQVAHLAAGLLDVGRISSGHLQLQQERLDLCAVLVRAIETLEPEFKARDQELVPTWTPASIWVMADASRLEQVFVNLLGNASKYTDAGGQISLWASANDQHAVVRIKDSGIGIAAHALPHIFDLYVRADATAARSGTGIGLAVVRAIVQLHGGSVTAASKGLGCGSEFAVRLPMHA